MRGLEKNPLRLRWRCGRDTRGGVHTERLCFCFGSSVNVHATVVQHLKLWAEGEVLRLPAQHDTNAGKRVAVR